MKREDLKLNAAVLLCLGVSQLASAGIGLDTTVSQTPFNGKIVEFTSETDFTVEFSYSTGSDVPEQVGRIAHVTNADLSHWGAQVNGNGYDYALVPVEDAVSLEPVAGPAESETQLPETDPETSKD